MHLGVVLVGALMIINANACAKGMKAYTSWWEENFPGRVLQLNLGSWVWVYRASGLLLLLGSLLGLFKKISTQ